MDMRRIDPGLLGEPQSVTGVDAWNFTGGTLTLTGFSGAASTVQVFWTSTGVDAGPTRPRALSLGAGRPNPFGRGTVFEVSIPLAVRPTLAQVCAAQMEPAGGFARINGDHLLRKSPCLGVAFGDQLVLGLSGQSFLRVTRGAQHSDLLHTRGVAMVTEIAEEVQ